MANELLQKQQERAAFVDTLTNRKSALVAESETIHSAAMTEKRAFSDDERTKLDANIKEVKSIAETIELQASMTNAFTDHNPTRTEVRDNAVDKPWGPEAQSNETSEQRRKRLTLGFGEYLRSVKDGAIAQSSGRQVDPRLLALNEGFEKRAAAAGSSESIPSDGGFLISPDFATEILSISYEQSLIWSLCRKLPLSEFTNAIKIPAVDEQSRKDGQRWGGVQMFWENEAQSLVGSKPTFALIEMVTKKLTGLYYATNEVLADARLLGSVALQAFGEEMGFKLDDACVRGTGAGQPLGVLKANCLIQVAKESGQAAATIVYENIKKMWGRAHARSRANLRWFINQDCLQQLFGLSQVVGVGGLPVFLPPGGATGTPYSQLFGRPVIEVEQCSTCGSVGDIILADWSQYLAVDKGDMQTATSMHVRFLSDEMTYRFIYRCDATPWWKTPLTPAQGTQTLSPFVTLAVR